MAASRRRNIRVVVLVAAIMTVMTGPVIYAPTLYRMFCNLTGFGGTVQQAAAPAASAPTAGKTVTVSFDANVAPGLPWEFRPEQWTIDVRPGEPAKVYYYAKNNSDETVVARATFNVTPYKAAPYFFKIECFCFTEEKLGPGESARMPLELYVDRQILEDPDTDDVRDITLSYTFFPRKDPPPEDVEAARDLKAGSKKLDAVLERSDGTRFENDAPRR